MRSELWRARCAPMIGMVCTFFAAIAPSARGDTAVSANIAAPSMFSLGLNRTAGWRFTVNDHLSVTHLGLYDWQGNGFEIAYPIGLWNSGGNLLALAEVSAGTANPLVGGFRYASIETLADVVLAPGETYTIGYHQATLAASDRAVHFNGFHQFSPLVNQVGGGWISAEPAPVLTMPDEVFLSFEQWFGPSFQFTVVPGSSGLAAFALAGAMSRRRRGA
jgi:hypothetical protein